MSEFRDMFDKYSEFVKFVFDSMTRHSLALGAMTYSIVYSRELGTYGALVFALGLIMFLIVCLFMIWGMFIYIPNKWYLPSSPIKLPKHRNGVFELVMLLYGVGVYYFLEKLIIPGFIMYPVKLPG